MLVLLSDLALEQHAKKEIKINGKIARFDTLRSLYKMHRWLEFIFKILKVRLKVVCSRQFQNLKKSNQSIKQTNSFLPFFLAQGVRKGDRVSIYLPMIPELVYTMLACARIGAVHSVVVGNTKTFLEWCFAPLGEIACGVSMYICWNTQDIRLLEFLFLFWKSLTWHAESAEKHAASATLWQLIRTSWPHYREIE